MGKKSPTAKRLERAAVRITMLEDRFLALVDECRRLRVIKVGLEDDLSRATGLLLTSADQFAARDITATASHLRDEANRLDPDCGPQGDAPAGVVAEGPDDAAIAASILDDRRRRAEVAADATRREAVTQKPRAAKKSAKRKR